MAIKFLYPYFTFSLGDMGGFFKYSNNLFFTGAYLVSIYLLGEAESRGGGGNHTLFSTLILTEQGSFSLALSFNVLQILNSERVSLR